MKTQRKTLWLCRDRGMDGYSPYKFYSVKPTRAADYIEERGCWLYWMVDVCPKEFHKISNVRLRPDQGPVEIEIVRAKKRKGGEE